MNIGSKTCYYSYAGGPQNTDFTLSVPSYAGTDLNDTFVVQRAEKVDKIEIDRNGARIGSVSPEAAIVIDAFGGDDTLIVNLEFGNAVPSGGVTFHGGDTNQELGDKLAVTDLGTDGSDYAFGRLTYNATGVGAGNLVFDGTLTVAFDGLDP